MITSSVFSTFVLIARLSGKSKIDKSEFVVKSFIIWLSVAKIIIPASQLPDFNDFSKSCNQSNLFSSYRLKCRRLLKTSRAIKVVILCAGGRQTCFPFKSDKRPSANSLLTKTNIGIIVVTPAARMLGRSAEVNAVPEKPMVGSPFACPT